MAKKSYRHGPEPQMEELPRPLDRVSPLPKSTLKDRPMMHKVEKMIDPGGGNPPFKAPKPGAINAPARPISQGYSMEARENEINEAARQEKAKKYNPQRRLLETPVNKYKREV